MGVIKRGTNLCVCVRKRLFRMKNPNSVIKVENEKKSRRRKEMERVIEAETKTKQKLVWKPLDPFFFSLREFQ